MKEYEDLSEMLLQEVLSDMANTFFGARADLDDMLEVFESFVEKLKSRQNEVDGWSGLLNTLLLEPETIRAFYSRLKVDPEFLVNQKEYPDSILPEKKPFSLTGKGEYVKFVQWAYDCLYRAVQGYLRGEGSNYTKGDVDSFEPNYTMLEHMCQLINKEVKRVNQMSPTCTLQYTRQFKPDVLDKEKVTGTGFTEYGCDDLDRRMRFKPIDFEKLGLKKYPDLPKTDTVKSEITSFAKDVYSSQTRRVKEVLTTLHGAIG